RTLVYVVDIWDRYVKACSSPARSLPFVLPVVLAQRPAWTMPRRLSEILDVPPELRDVLGTPIELELIVDDLSGSVLADPHADHGTKALVELTRALLHAHANRSVLTEQRIARLAPLFDTVLDELGPDDMRTIWRYVVSVFEPDSVFRAIILAAVDKENREM